MAPLTVAERLRRYKLKRKLEDSKAYSEMNAAECEKYRQSFIEEQKKEAYLRKLMRKKKYRARKRDEKEKVLCESSSSQAPVTTAERSNVYKFRTSTLSLTTAERLENMLKSRISLPPLRTTETSGNVYKSRTKQGPLTSAEGLTTVHKSSRNKAPLTTVKQCRRYRLKKKLEDPEAFLEKNAEICRKYGEGFSEEQKKEAKLRSETRGQKYRAQKRAVRENVLCKSSTSRVSLTTTERSGNVLRSKTRRAPLTTAKQSMNVCKSSTSKASSTGAQRSKRHREKMKKVLSEEQKKEINLTCALEKQKYRARKRAEEGEQTSWGSLTTVEGLGNVSESRTRQSPLTPAERSKRYRQKKMEEDPKTYLERHAERSRKYRQSLSEEQKKEANLRFAIQKRLYRARKRTEEGKKANPLSLTTAQRPGNVYMFWASLAPQTCTDLSRNAQKSKTGQTPMTPAERTKRYRQKKKEEDPKAYLEKDADRARKYRQGLSEKQKKEARLRYARQKQMDRFRKKAEEREKLLSNSRISQTALTSTEQLRKFRLIKKEEDSNALPEMNIEKCGIYRQSFSEEERRETSLRNVRQIQECETKKTYEGGEKLVCESRQDSSKAVIETECGLSHSHIPRKKEMVATIPRKIDLDFTVPSAGKQRRSIALTKKIKEAVALYYIEDHISRPLPGKKRTRPLRSTVIKKKGKNEQVPRRILCYTIKEVYWLFKLEPKHALMQIGISEFAELLPTDVELTNYESQNLYCCPYCENIKLLLKSVSWDNSIRFTSDLVDYVLCSSENVDCLLRQCRKCTLARDCSEEIEALMDDGHIDILVHQWDGGHLMIEEFPNTSDLAHAIYKQLGPYVIHSCYTSLQAQAFSHQKEMLICLPNTIIVEVDFAENYGINCQDKVTGAGFTDEVVTIYTCVIHYVSDNEVHTKSVAVISDTQHHGTLEAQVFNKEIFKYIKNELNHEFEHVVVWTEPHTHFKNCYAMMAMTFYRELYNITVEWNFHEMYHGEGLHDAIAAVLKSQVDKAKLNGCQSVNDARSFYDAAQNFVTGVKLLFVSTADINLHKSTFDEMWMNVKGPKGFHKCRRIKVIEKYRIELYYDSRDSQPYVSCNLLPAEA